MQKSLFGGLAPFELKIKYNDITADSSENANDSHIHNECEIYLNISGDVSFEVEGTVYPVVSGDAIITRPGEYHHCIYHSNKPHRHYWLLFTPYGNERLFDVFYSRELGKGNLLTPPPEKSGLAANICAKLMKCKSEAERYMLFFELINLLNGFKGISKSKASDSNYITEVVSYINSVLSEKLSVKDIARKFNVSVATLERHFRRSLNIGPAEYIKKKRLANAARLLSLGESVTDAAAQSGFSDTSSFIALFRESYGITPLKYKKTLLK